MFEIGLRKQAVGTAETILGALHLPLAAQYRTQEQGITLSIPEDLSNARDAQGVKLRGYLNQHPLGKGKGLIMVIHGWLGSSHTPDTMHLGSSLYAAGFDTFRINLRDHGDSLPLNPGLFHGGLIEELIAATKQVSQLCPNDNFAVVGSSLGGNFAMRLGLESAAKEIPNLKQIVAVCPAVNPQHSAQLIDKNPLFKKFFTYLWQRALRRKEKLFPNLYPFRSLGIHNLKSVNEITSMLFNQFFHFESLEAYYQSYEINKRTLDQLTTPCTVIASENDPVIYIEDFEDLAGAPNLRLHLQHRGGHIGFVNPIKLQRYLSHLVVENLA